jgi:Zn finger protein HypA/HybF involved in hydrogenase expression
MHDFHLADQIAKIAKDHAAKNNLSQITKIVIELGDVIEHGESILPENLEYNIKLLLPVDKVEITSIPGNSWKLVSIEGGPF